MTLVTLLIIVILILWTIEKSIALMVQFLNASKGVTKFIRRMLFIAFVFAAFFFPDETGNLLRPVFIYLYKLGSQLFLLVSDIAMELASAMRGSPGN